MNLIVAFEMPHHLWPMRRVEVVQIRWHRGHDQWGRWKGNNEWKIETVSGQVWMNECMWVCWSLSWFMINTGVCLLPSFLIHSSPFVPSLSHVVPRPTCMLHSCSHLQLHPLLLFFSFQFFLPTPNSNFEQEKSKWRDATTNTSFLISLTQ